MFLIGGADDVAASRARLVDASWFAGDEIRALGAGFQCVTLVVGGRQRDGGGERALILRLAKSGDVAGVERIDVDARMTPQCDATSAQAHGTSPHVVVALVGGSSSFVLLCERRASTD